MVHGQERRLSKHGVLEVFAKYDFEGVSQIAIDEDWSALRARPVGEIKRLTRKTAMSEKGKTRLRQQDPTGRGGGS
jgi:hypothetical protein